MTIIRPPAVSGTFYPADPHVLRATVDSLLAQASPLGPVPAALIAPHAGYAYSGPVAASAYALLAERSPRIRRVLLLGPAHTVYLRGLAASSAQAFETPLGRVRLDEEGQATALSFPQVQVHDEAHAREHALEVHLPFLQVALGTFTLIPLVVGDASDSEVAEVIRALWTGPDTLVVVSSDLSHFLDYDTACTLDAATARSIEVLNPEGLGEGSACGRIPSRGLLVEAKRRGLTATIVDLRNSGDTAGPRTEVVGYGSFVFA